MEVEPGLFVCHRNWLDVKQEQLEKARGAAMTQIIQRFGVSVFFRWFDLWVGAYWDRDNKVLYVCPIPMFGLKIKMPWRRGRKSGFGSTGVK